MGVTDFIPFVQKAAFTITILNLSAAIGRTIIGFIADRFGPVNSLLLVTLLSGLSQMLVWSFVTTYGGIVRNIFPLFSLLPSSLIPRLTRRLTFSVALANAPRWYSLSCMASTVVVLFL